MQNAKQNSMKNKHSRGELDHEGSSKMEAENQDMAFVNDTLENAESQTTPIGAVEKVKQ
jgi:hypothetical protein